MVWICIPDVNFVLPVGYSMFSVVDICIKVCYLKTFNEVF